MICPGFGCYANLHKLSGGISAAAAFTFIWNVLDVPVGAMPVTLSKETELEYESAHDDAMTK